jgi:hypothetical protein
MGIMNRSSDWWPLYSGNSGTIPFMGDFYTPCITTCLICTLTYTRRSMREGPAGDSLRNTANSLGIQSTHFQRGPAPYFNKIWVSSLDDLAKKKIRTGLKLAGTVGGNGSSRRSVGGPRNFIPRSAGDGRWDLESTVALSNTGKYYEGCQIPVGWELGARRPFSLQ